MRNGEVFPDVCVALFYDGTQLAPGTCTYRIAAVDTAGNESAWTEPMSQTVVAPPTPTENDVSLEPELRRHPGHQLPRPPQREARVSGTPTRTGTFSFTVQVQDNTGATARRTFSITVRAS